jgi:ribosomal protein S18 acetylase RimI-like enzyme
MTHSVVHVAAPVQPAYVALPKGRVVVVRPAEPSDTAAVAVLHSRCGPRTLHDRYLSPPPRVTSTTLRALVAPPGGCALAAVTKAGDIVGLIQVAGSEEPGTADLALIVRDDYQRVGLGSLLARHGIRTAMAMGFTELTSCGTARNVRLVRMLGRLGLGPYLRTADGYVHLRVPVAAAVVAAGLDRPAIDLTTTDLTTIDLTEPARMPAGAEPAA